MMIYSTDIIINLSEHRQVFHVCFIRNATLYGYCMNLREGRTGRVQASYNLDTGILEKCWYQEEPRVYLDKYDARFIECEEGTEGSIVVSEYNHPPIPRGKIVCKLPWLDPSAERLITALASHQVKGDEIQKGLRVIVNLADSYKLVESYLGGWNFTVGGKLLSVASLIQAVAKAN